MSGLEPIPTRVHERLFVRYDAINSVHMQVLLHRTASNRRGGASATVKGLTVNTAYNGVQASKLHQVAWRKSTHSNPSGNCVEAAQLPAGEVAVRNSRFPDGPALIFTRAEWDAFLLGARDGDFDRPERYVG
jgi:hypothetical protein